MAKGMRKCKVCGCMYEYCYTQRQNPNTFRYQDVACCPEHGQIYFARIMESRSKKKVSESEPVVVEDPVVAEEPVDTVEPVVAEESVEAVPEPEQDEPKAESAPKVQSATHRKSRTHKNSVTDSEDKVEVETEQADLEVEPKDSLE